MKSINHKEGINEGVVPINRKGSQGGLVLKSEKNIKIGKGKDGKYRDSNREMHIWNEKENDEHVCSPSCIASKYAF
ncbi:hypothetical protein RYX36_034739 [Vicia faba]